MSKLTTFSKVLIGIGLVGFIAIVLMTCNACLSGCRNNQNTGYYQQQPVQYVSPQPTVQYVTNPDGTGFWMNYLLYRSLMDNGGQTNVYNYYQQHKNDEDYQPSGQRRYQQDNEVYQEQVRTQKSNGFGSRPVETNKSSGFGSKPTETKKSSGFGTYTPSTTSNSSSTSTQTKKSSGFGWGNSSSTSKSINTSKSSGFGSSSSKSTSTSKSSGFGRKKN
jgi:hypothetical protein